MRSRAALGLGQKNHLQGRDTMRRLLWSKMWDLVDLSCVQFEVLWASEEGWFCLASREGEKRQLSTEAIGGIMVSCITHNYTPRGNTFTLVCIIYVKRRGVCSKLQLAGQLFLPEIHHVFHTVVPMFPIRRRTCCKYIAPCHSTLRSVSERKNG